jgi:hypothetical protein
VHHRLASVVAVTEDERLVQTFRATATTCERRAPLYARLCRSIADDAPTRRLLLHAPPEQRLPVLLLACVHWLLLTEPEHELRRFYPNLIDESSARALDRGDPFPEFKAFCARNEPRLAGLLATRTTQTNEVGRCATLLPALGLLAADVGPLALVDVGTSAGLTLMLDRYRYHYTPGGVLGGPSRVVLPCDTRGAVPVPDRMPVVSKRIGLDQQPIDLTDGDAAAWLEACVWPDQADRFQRLRHAIEVARSDPPPLRQGDAVADLLSTIRAVADGGHPVVTTTWVLCYLSEQQRGEFLAELDSFGRADDLSWIAAESPAQTSGLPAPDDAGVHHLTVVTSTRWRGGKRTVTHLATAHPHGFWLHWT